MMALILGLCGMWALLLGALWKGYLPVHPALRELWAGTTPGRVFAAVLEQPPRPSQAQPPAEPAQFDTHAEPLLEEQVRALLYATRYEELEQLLRQLRQEYAQDPSREERLHQAYSAFEAAAAEEARLREEVDAWVQARPGSAEAKLAHCVQRVAQSWTRRGGRFSNKVAAEAMEDFHRLLELTLPEAEASLARDSAHPVAWRARIRIAGGLGAAKAVSPLRKAVLAQAPQSYFVHKALLNFLQPRWGGSLAAMEAHAAAAQAAVARNPRLAVLQGFPYWSHGKDLESDGAYAEALAQFDRALSFGDEAYFLEARADALFELLRFPESLADLKREDQRFPSTQTREAVAGAQERMRNKAYRLHRADEHAQALQAYAAYLELWPDDADVLFYQAEVLASLDRHAEALRSYQRVIALQPLRFEAVRGADHVLARERRWNEILSLWERYLAGAPDQAGAYLERGGTYFHMGDLERAYADATKACELGLDKACAWQRRLATHPALAGRT